MRVEQRLREVRDCIAQVATASGRSPDVVQLIGVSKGAPVEAIADAVSAGLEDFGENRVQEAAPKVPFIKQRAPNPIRWHLIGHLQSNKVRPALDLFDELQSVDGLAIALKISGAANRDIPIFLEVQFAETTGRFGFAPDNVAEAFDIIAEYPHPSIRGLMTVAPLGLEPDGVRQIFRQLREIRDRLQESHPSFGPLGLSMGMTDDYAIAIQEGATVVRIGRAIFAA